MRIIIYTGKGGVGKTSIAAATGVRLASQGYRTLVISTIRHTACRIRSNCLLEANRYRSVNGYGVKR